MMMDAAIEIKKPEPDSQYRLKPCKCGSDNVAYVKYLDSPEEAWAVKCFDCGFTVARLPGIRVRHEAQGAWNKAVGV